MACRGRGRRERWTKVVGRCERMMRRGRGQRVLLLRCRRRRWRWRSGLLLLLLLLLESRITPSPPGRGLPLRLRRSWGVLVIVVRRVVVGIHDAGGVSRRARRRAGVSCAGRSCRCRCNCTGMAVGQERLPLARSFRNCAMEISDAVGCCVSPQSSNAPFTSFSSGAYLTTTSRKNTEDSTSSQDWVKGQLGRMRLSRRPKVCLLLSLGPASW